MFEAIALFDGNTYIALPNLEVLPFEFFLLFYATKQLNWYK